MSFPRKKAVAGLLLLIGLGFLGFVLTDKRPVDLQTFDPTSVARAETAAWKAYYSEEWVELFSAVYDFGTSQYGFSKIDSLRLGYHAARAAQLFRTLPASQRDWEAEVAIRPYFQIFSERSGRPFDYHKVARLEVAWWEMRRQQRPPEAWAQAIAEQSGIIFDRPAELFLPATRLRVEAMCYRDDRRNGRMKEADWKHVQDLLTQSAQTLWDAVHATNESKN